MVFIVSLYAYYFTEGDSSFLLDGLDRFSHHLYNMESLYRAVSITILAIIPLATSLRIAAIAWFWFRKSKISFYTVTYHPVYSFVCSMYESTFIYIYKKNNSKSNLFHYRYLSLFRFGHSEKLLFYATHLIF